MRQEHRPVSAGRAWPAKLGPLSKALAVGVAAVATEAGCPGCGRRSEQKTGRRNPPSEALVPPRAPPLENRSSFSFGPEWGIEYR